MADSGEYKFNVKNDCDNEKNDVSINHVSNHLLSLIYL
jgi:hypothetical protein